MPYAGGQLLTATDLNNSFATKKDISELQAQLGAVNGIATLDAGGRVSLAQLPVMVAKYKGSFASLAAVVAAFPTAADGDWAIVSRPAVVATVVVWDADAAPAAWVEIANTPSTAGAVAFTPVGSVAATNVQTAIQEVDAEKFPIAGGTLTGNATISNTAPALTLHESDAALDAKYWRVSADAGVLDFSTVNDALAASEVWMRVSRTGNDVGVVDFVGRAAAELRRAGNVLWDDDNYSALTRAAKFGGFNMPMNVGLLVTAAAGALTIALKGADGADPSALNPVLLPFRADALATGSPVWRSVVAAQSLVLSSGSTLGMTGTGPARIWIVDFDDAGTTRLGAINCSTYGAAPRIFPLTEAHSTSVAEGGAGAADSAGVFYTGALVTSKPYRILGYVEWTSILAGTWTTPTIVQLFGPGVPRPGDTIQAISAYELTGSVINSLTLTDVTGATITITPASGANVVEAEFAAACTAAAAGASLNSAAKLQLLRGATVIHGPITLGVVSGGGANLQTEASFHMRRLDAPASVAATTYKLQHSNSIAANHNVTTSNISAIVREIMG